MNQELFDRLIVASGKLATVSELAADILSEEYDDLVRPSIDEVRDILNECPTPSSEWDGMLREEDIDFRPYFTAGQEDLRGPRGIKGTHKITGIARESNSKPTLEENKEVVIKALSKAVSERYQATKK